MTCFWSREFKDGRLDVRLCAPARGREIGLRAGVLACANGPEERLLALRTTVIRQRQTHDQISEPESPAFDLGSATGLPPKGILLSTLRYFTQYSPLCPHGPLILNRRPGAKHSVPNVQS